MRANFDKDWEVEKRGGDNGYKRKTPKHSKMGPTKKPKYKNWD